MDSIVEEDKARILEFALNMARGAGEIQMRFFRGKALDIATKFNDYDVLTAADKASERYLIEEIKTRFPGHAILTEESGEVATGSDYRWVIDPLDGTTNFSQGLPIFSVSIALEYRGEPIVGVVFAPYLNELFHAVKGEGAYLNNQRIKCSDKDKLEESVVATGIPYDKNVNHDNNIRELGKVTPKVRGLRRLGSAALDLSYVAVGYFDAYWELNLNRWDISAGSLIAQEAGAKIFSIRENRKHSILVSSPGICDKMLEILLTPKLHHSSR